MFRRLVLALAVLMFSRTPALAQPAYSGVFFFGTSELDTGNWLENPALAGNPFAPTPERGFYKGRWQSGPAWSDYFAEALGYNALASLLGGNNYAYGLGWLGPLAGETPPPGSLSAQSALYFGSQIDAALAAHPFGLASDALYVVTIGSNDPSFYGRTVVDAPAVAALAVAQIQRLANAGARSLLVQTVGGTDAYTVTYNQHLLNGLAAISGITVSVLDTRTFNQTVALAPGFLTGLGITDFGSCLADAACAAAAIAKTTKGEAYFDNTHFLFDNIHRDTKVAEALANYALTRLPYTVPEPGTVALLAFGLLGTGLLRMQRR